MYMYHVIVTTCTCTYLYKLYYVGKHCFLVMKTKPLSIIVMYVHYSVTKAGCIINS